MRRSDELDTRRHPAHDHGVESPSLLETMIRLPGRRSSGFPPRRWPRSTPSTTLAERLDRLMTLLERIEGGVNKAGTGIDLAALGISRAVSGLEQAVGTLDASLPSLSDSASALRSLTERLSGVAIELANELPKATRSLQEVSPELASVVGLLDDRFAHLDTVVTELARLDGGVIGTIPGMRRVLRVDARRPIPFEPTLSDKEDPWVPRDQDAALAVVQATSVPIHDIGTAIYLSPDVFGWAAEWGWSNPFAFYFAGRGGMLGDVGADVVTSAMGWFEPDAVSAMYAEGIGVAGRHGGGRPDGRGAREVGREALRRRRGPRRASSPSPRSWSTDSRARPSRSSSGGGTPPQCRVRRGPGGPADADPARVARRAPPRRHDGRRALPARGDPDQRGRGPGEVLRLVGALPRRQRPSRPSTTRPRR